MPGWLCILRCHRNAVLPVAGVVLAGICRAKAEDIDLGTAGQYNIYVIHNDTQGGSDVGSSGPNSPMGVAVGNNFQTTGTTVKGNVVVGGSYSNSGNTVTGNVLANSVDWNTPTATGTVSSITSVTLDGGGGSVGGGVFYETSYNGFSYISHTQVASGSITYPFNFSTASSDVTTLSSELHAQPSTPGSSVTGGNNNQLHLSGTGSNFYVFHVTSTQLADMNDFLISVTGLQGATPTVVVDVTDVGGDSDQFHSNSLSLSGTDSNHVLFNFSQATSLDTNHDGINGSLLAPHANVDFNSGDINGTLIAYDLYGSGEAHAYQFDGNLVVPEPTALALSAMGGLTLLIRRRTNTQVR